MHFECKSVDDWVSVVCLQENADGGVKCRKTWGECVRKDIELLDLKLEWAIFRDVWRNSV